MLGLINGDHNVIITEDIHSFGPVLNTFEVNRPLIGAICKCCIEISVEKEDSICSLFVGPVQVIFQKADITAYEVVIQKFIVAKAF